MHLLWSWVQPITLMIAEWKNHGGAGNGEIPSQMILVAGWRRHVKRRGRELVEWWVIVESSE